MITQTTRKNKPIVVGIIGGVASGKSAVTALFKSFGAEIISADAIAHEVLKQPQIAEAIINEFGAEILMEGDEKHPEHRVIDRKKLGERVFGTNAEARRRALESIVHPPIRERARNQLSELTAVTSARWIVLDAPLLIEGGWMPFCDRIVFVDTSPSLREKFAIQRGWTVEEWHRREDAQMGLDEKRKFASDILVNDQDLNTLKQRVQAMIQSWDN